MTDTLALINLHDKSSADLAVNSSFEIDIRFGWKQKARQNTAHATIVWVPGDGSGSAGKVIAPRYPGRNPRPLGTLDELFTVFCGAYDPSAPEDEKAQYVNTRLLFDDWYASIYRSAHGTYAIDSVTWVTAKLERRYGATLQIVGRVQAMIPDIQHADAAPATADINYELLPADAGES